MTTEPKVAPATKERKAMSELYVHFTSTRDEISAGVYRGEELYPRDVMGVGATERDALIALAESLARCIVETDKRATIHSIATEDDSVEPAERPLEKARRLVEHTIEALECSLGKVDRGRWPDLSDADRYRELREAIVANVDCLRRDFPK